MTIDDLIFEGKSFEITYEEAHLEPAGFGMAAQIPGRYFLTKGNNDSFYQWIQKCRRYIAINFPNDISSEHFDAENVKNITDRKLKEMVGALEALKEMPSLCELKEKAPQSVQNIHISQTQTVTIDIIIEAIKEELGKHGIQSLKDISGDTPAEKKNNLLSKLKSFGENTLASIVANIISNPQIWSQL